MQDFTRPNPTRELRGQDLALSSEVSFFQKVYFWMCGGLALSAVVGYSLAQSVGWKSFLASGFSAILIIGVQIGLVLAISFMRDKLSVPFVRGLFLLYAASIGMTMSLVLIIYDSGIIFKALICTSAVYGSMAAYGLLTKKSLQAWGGFLYMGLVGLFVATIVNIFARSAMVDYIICWVGVLVFAGLTAYDHQKLRVIHAGGFGNSDIENKTVIMGALELFLDFINLFLFFVRILGSRN
jgi:FtsH-binding integral membrane protein